MDEKNLTDISLSAVLIGIRFQRTWRILDITGEMIDTIFRDKKSPFMLDTKYFPRVREEDKARVLYNPDTNCFLRINIDDLIFRHEFEKTKKDLAWVFSSVKHFLIPKIIDDYDIKRITRIGIVYYHYLDLENLNMEDVKNIIGEELGRPNKFEMSFHKKIDAVAATIKKNINDYQNIIHSIKVKQYDKEDAQKQRYEIGIDFQYYFDPSVDNFSGWNIDKFIASNQIYLNDKFYPWLKNIFSNFNIQQLK
ncbi:hypothetical protein ACFLRM_00705 [Acidobacteriota bacterium]